MPKKPFITEDFLLETKTASRLYHQYAEPMPVIDYHCHLPPAQIADDEVHETITSIWLDGDHYKWRAMRTLGIDEKFITGDADPFEKFMKWAETVPYTVRNPLYHWTHLELRRYFGIKDLLTKDSAESIYYECNNQLNHPENSTRGLLKKMNVKVVCTTDDPVDDLKYHEQIAKDNFEIQIRPTFRPDGFILINKDNFLKRLWVLSEISGIGIESFDDLIEAIRRRADYFHKRGCRLSDHGLEKCYARDYELPEVNRVFKKRVEGKEVNPDEAEQYMSAMLHQLGVIYAEKGWVQQFHLGALRDNNWRLLSKLGPDTGFDSIGDFTQAKGLSRLFDRLDSENKLAKTVIYNLNPADNEVFATMTGNFNDGSVKGKMQFGSGWWYNDQKEGMEKQMNILSNMGLLSCFIGMLTDSRSFLSYPRHEYFRRVLCNLLGNDMENGLIPDDIEWTGKLVQDICYNNAKNYFDFGL